MDSIRHWCQTGLLFPEFVSWCSSILPLLKKNSFQPISIRSHYDAGMQGLAPGKK
jgi:hypothetical protein